jgi:hypothetical protein
MYCDASVSGLRYSVNVEVFRRIGCRSDGLPIQKE